MLGYWGMGLLKIVIISFIEVIVILCKEIKKYVWSY